MPHVEVYTDGGCEPNPGPGGYGVVLMCFLRIFAAIQMTFFWLGGAP